jgi:hypothetical protein
MGLKRRGRPVKLADATATTVRLPATLLNQLRFFSLVSHQSMNDMISAVVSDWWDGRPLPAPPSAQEKATFAKLAEKRAQAQDRVSDPRSREMSRGHHDRT